MLQTRVRKFSGTRTRPHQL